MNGPSRQHTAGRDAVASPPPGGWAGLRRRLGRWLPWPVHLLVQRLRAGRRADISPCVSDVRRFSFGVAGDLEVYWLDAPLGAGPAASWYMAGVEVMRFDCLSPDQAHMHVNLWQSAVLARDSLPRLHFPPGTVEEHIERAAYELRVNLRSHAYLVETDRRVRKLPCPDEETMTRAAQVMRAELTDLAKRHAAPADVALAGDAQPR
jgi:hypothetical protein